MSRIGVCGVGGKMGRAIVRSIDAAKCSVANSFDVEGAPIFGKDPLLDELGKESGATVTTISEAAVVDCDAIIDFSAPQATLLLLDAAVATETPLVIATTGLNDAAEAKIAEAAKTIPIVRATNFSLGVNLLFKLAEIGAQALGSSFDAEVFEAHHRRKVDSPSGTASTLVRSIKSGHEKYEKSQEVYRDRAILGARTDQEIGMQVLRGGDIVGEHTVFFCGEGERIELTHRATDRRIFSDGAVKAALFASTAKPGLYNMFDVLHI